MGNYQSSFHVVDLKLDNEPSLLYCRWRSSCSATSTAVTTDFLPMRGGAQWWCLPLIQQLVSGTDTSPNKVRLAHNCSHLILHWIDFLRNSWGPVIWKLFHTVRSFLDVLYPVWYCGSVTRNSLTLMIIIEIVSHADFHVFCRNYARIYCS